MIVGVDPGLNGALACVGRDLSVSVYTIPMRMQPRTGKKPIPRYDYDGLFALVRVLAMLGPDFFVLEDVHGRGTDGAAGAFNFGETKGALRMALVAAGVPYRLVAPATWKTRLRCPADKDATRAFASQVFPHAAKLWTRVADDGKAEAALLGYYGIKELL